MKKKVLDALEQFSRAMLAPLSYLSVAGLLLVAGALLTSKPLQQLVPALAWPPLVQAGQVLYNCMMALLNNLSLLFCVGIAAVLAKREKQQAALIALMSGLLCLTACHTGLVQHDLLADPSGLSGLYGTGQTTVLGIQTMDLGVLGGIVLGLAVSWIYNHTCERQYRGVLSQLCSGTRGSFVGAACFAMLFGYGACFFWPPVQRCITALTGLIAASGNAGLFLYGFLERFLIPTGLHHLIYTPFQFSALGGSLSVQDTTYTGAYAVMMMEYNLDLPFSEGIVWMYTGFTKTFGYFGIAAAFLFCARKENRRKTAATLLPLAFTASLASITEPLDFLFCFASPVLWAAHAVIAGTFIVLLHVFHVTGFTSNLLGSLMMNLSAGAERTNYPVLYLLGAAEILTYFVVFSVLIRALDLHTPGREAPPAARPQTLTADQIRQLLAALGGAENIRSLDCCMTRLRVTLRDTARLDEAALRTLPGSGIVVQGDQVQIVLGLQAQAVCRAVQEQLQPPVLC